ncbi:GPW/gp25 family protein [Tateyamaria omphalii]|uniref:Baseplate protein n=1 Tax=Tateyamaria omphalii TaxID=299262 RepID=A0A1P8MVL1_9RHOB|nr:GPW/gp25 family protein [Tateyamaria omphalii]APX11979.1 baseplate protein [Tateyamaria omphalii]
MPEPRGYLGTGWKFPLQVTPSGAIATARHEQRIEESIYLILSTARGERVMLPDFGCGIHDRVFEPANPATITIIIDSIRQALVTYEPRIDVLNVSAEPSGETPNLLLIRVDYRIINNNVFGNLVYPYFIEEGG